MKLVEIADAASQAGLSLVGAFHCEPDDLAPQDLRTLVLLGPADSTMWAHFRISTEARDGLPDPLDRWSCRVIGGLAASLGGVALFPFGRPPWLPFQRWAARGEAAVVSPVGIQVSPRRGLWASYRGALGFAARLRLDAFSEEYRRDPCLGCAAPCLRACPVDAFADGTYDVPACVVHVKGEFGTACRDGCLVRVSCPAGGGMDLPLEQRAFHMAAFLRALAPLSTDDREKLWTVETES